MSLPSPSTPPTVTFKATVTATLQELSDKLADPKQIPEIHPLIYRTEVTEQHQEGELEVFSFGVWENVPLLGLKLPNHYKGQLRRERSTPAVVILEGWSQPGIHLFIQFHIEALGSGQCTVTDSVWIKAPWFLRAFMQKTVSAAHKAQLDKLVAAFAAKA